MDIFGGHHKFGLYLGSFLCILGSLLKVKVNKGGGGIFWLAKISNIFWRVLKIPDIFWCER